MKKYSTILLLLCVIALCAASCCPAEIKGGKYTRSTYIIAFYKMAGIDALTKEVTIYGDAYSQISVLPTRDVQEIASLYDENTNLFYQLCEERNDLDYPAQKVHKLEHSPLFDCSFLAYDISQVELICKQNWDDSHPTGSALNDIARFAGLTVQPFLSSGYKMYDYAVNTLSDFFYSAYPLQNHDEREYYPIDKPLDELTEEDMRTWTAGAASAIKTWDYYNKDDWGFFLASFFLPKHKGEEKVDVEIILTDKAGSVYKTVVSL